MVQQAFGATLGGNALQYVAEAGRSRPHGRAALALLGQAAKVGDVLDRDRPCPASLFRKGTCVLVRRVGWRGPRERTLADGRERVASREVSRCVVEPRRPSSSPKPSTLGRGREQGEDEVSSSLSGGQEGGGLHKWFGVGGTSSASRARAPPTAAGRYSSTECGRFRSNWTRNRRKLSQIRPNV